MEPILEVDLSGKSFPAAGQAPPRAVLGPVRFSLGPGEVVALTGPSGSGKTTLLNIVADLDPSYEGRIVRRAQNLAYVFQEPRLLPWRTVEENLALVLPETAASPSRIVAALEEVGLGEARSSFASRLSLGMARRVALARAFIIEPDLLLLDEPFASLDGPTARRLRLLLLELLARRRTAALFVTHDLGEAVMLASRILVLGGSPATIQLDRAVSLSRAERLDPAVVAAFTCALDLGSEIGLLAEMA